MRGKHLYPAHRRDGAQWVYMLGRKDGGFKVGRTGWVTSRLHHHICSRIGWYHVGPVGTQEATKALEQNLIRAFAAKGRRVGLTENFHGIDKATAFAVLRSVTEKVV